MELFYAPEKCNEVQLAFLTAVYGVILYQASQLIAGGSELLLLFPAVAGIVGSVVLPILGAVPDGVMVLFSGLGPDAQNQVSVGVGALAGSTVMLLTFPWFIAVMSGSVPLVKGLPKYGPLAKDEIPNKGSGVMYQDTLQKTAKIMIATTGLFLLIQLPATYEEMVTNSTVSQGKSENLFALFGLLACIAAFCAYLAYCVKEANEDKQLEAVIDGIKKRQISIGAALRFAKDTGNTDAGMHEGSFESMDKKDQDRLAKIVRPFFAMYDADQSRTLDLAELSNLLYDLGEKRENDFSDWIRGRGSESPVERKLRKIDLNQDGKITLTELLSFLAKYLKERKLKKLEKHGGAARIMPAYTEEEEEEEMPEDLADLSPEQQRKKLLFRSCWMMGVGTAMVLVFSDPMVDILSDWGRRLEISPFYISFVLAPFASNASELLSAYTYASKKTSKSITTALSTLIGAACMNNTFCLAIFLALVYCKSLAWQFTAETLAIIVIQCVIGGLVIARRVQTKTTAFIILACYPGCLFLVWFFENIVGWD